MGNESERAMAELAEGLLKYTKEQEDGSVIYKGFRLRPLGPAPDTLDISVWYMQLKLDIEELIRRNPECSL